MWNPAMGKLNGTGVNTYPSDSIFMFDIESDSVSAIRISNRPGHLEAMHLHAIDAFIDPTDDKKITFFLNNHAVPSNVKEAHIIGADSTVEIFDTVLGSLDWRWVKSVRHDLVVAPNSIVATGPRSFYVTNDHNAKVSQVSDSITIIPSNLFDYGS